MISNDLPSLNNESDSKGKLNDILSNLETSLLFDDIPSVFVHSERENGSESQPSTSDNTESVVVSQQLEVRCDFNNSTLKF